MAMMNPIHITRLASDANLGIGTKLKFVSTVRRKARRIDK